MASTRSSPRSAISAIFQSNKLAIDIKGGFVPNYVISPGKEHVVESIRALAKKSSTVLLATDPDREGDGDCRARRRDSRALRNQRASCFYEITPAAIKEAIALSAAARCQPSQSSRGPAVSSTDLLATTCPGSFGKAPLRTLSRTRPVTCAPYIGRARKTDLRLCPGNLFSVYGQFFDRRSEASHAHSYQPTSAKKG